MGNTFTTIGFLCSELPSRQIGVVQDFRWPLPRKSKKRVMPIIEYMAQLRDFCLGISNHITNGE